MTYAAWGVYILQSPSLRLVFFRENRLEAIQRQCTRDLLRLNNVSTFFVVFNVILALYVDGYTFNLFGDPLFYSLMLA